MKPKRNKNKSRPKYQTGQFYRFKGNPQLYKAINSGTIIKVAPDANPGDRRPVKSILER